jgi:hypothetical protein
MANENLIGFERNFINTRPCSESINQGNRMRKCLPKLLAAVVGGLLVLHGFPRSALAEQAACPFAGQQPMLLVQLFFGQGINGRRAVTAKEWRSFLGQTVTPRLPNGFTVYDADGQWMDPRTHSVSREKTKVMVVAVDDTPEIRMQIEELTAAYRQRFHQQSVGVVTSSACGAF